MTGNEYQKLAAKTIDYRLTRWNKLTEAALGMNGEAGEASEIIKKALFEGEKIDRERLTEELGDTLWYLTEAATEMDIPLDEIMENNIRKIKERYPECFREEKA